MAVNKTEHHGMKMNLPRALAVLKSRCPNHWVRAHAKMMDKTRKDHGLPGVVLHIGFLLEHVSDWRDEHGAVDFLREWLNKETAR